MERHWRRAIELVAFALFGLGGLFLGALVFPFVWILPASREKKTARIQKTIHYTFRLFLWFLETARAMEFRFEDAALLREGGAGLIIANHPTLLDVVLLIAQLPRVDCIVKKDLWSNVFIRPIVSWAGYIPNDDGLELMEAAVERVRQGRKVIVFPEGTRSLPERLQSFNTGFAYIAVRTHCSLWPVILTCRPPALSKGQSVFSVPERRARLTGIAAAPLDPATYYAPDDRDPVAARKVAAAVEHYFEERVEHGKA